MAGKPKYDWESLRKLYVSGEVDELVELSRERTGDDSFPPYDIVRRKAAKEGWAEQQRFFRREVATRAAAKVVNQAFQPQVTKQVTGQDVRLAGQVTPEDVSRKAEEIIDNVEAIARHIKLAKILQHVGYLHVRSIDPAKLSTKDAIAMIQLGTDLERKALALYEPKQQAQIDVEVNFEALSTGELEMVRQAIAKTIPSQVN